MLFVVVGFSMLYPNLSMTILRHWNHRREEFSRRNRTHNLLKVIITLFLKLVFVRLPDWSSSINESSESVGINDDDEIGFARISQMLNVRRIGEVKVNFSLLIREDFDIENHLLMSNRQREREQRERESAPFFSFATRDTLIGMILFAI